MQIIVFDNLQKNVKSYMYMAIFTIVMIALAVILYNFIFKNM